MLLFAALFILYGQVQAVDAKIKNIQPPLKSKISAFGLPLNRFISFWSSAQRRKLLVGVVVVQTLVTLLILIGLIFGQQGFLQNSVNNHALSLGSSINVLIGSKPIAERLEVVEAYFKAQKEYPGLKFISLYDLSGSQIVSFGALENKPAMQELNLEDLRKAGGTWFIEEEFDHFDVLVPVRREQATIAWLRLIIANDDSVALFRQELAIGASLVLSSLLFAIVLVYASTRRMQQSMSHLVDVAGRFRAGERDLRIKLSHDDELSALGKRFNELADTVNNREAELFDQREHLEEVVLERTRDLVREVRERQVAEDQVKMIVESAMEGIILVDANGEILSFNPAAATIFGYTQEEVLGANLNIIIPIVEEDGEPLSLTSYIKDVERGRSGERGTEIVSRRSNGDDFFMELAISQFKDQNRDYYTLIVRDISERKEAEQQLRDTLETLQLTQAELVQSEKLASLGGLVAGVAHEINTPIGVGVTAASHLREKAENLQNSFEQGKLKKSDFQSFLDIAIKSTQIIHSNLMRASDLIKSFKQVAVDQSSDARRSFSLVEYIEDVLVSLQPQLKRFKHEISVGGDKDIIVESLPGPIAQIITNLVMNSVIHAFSDDEQGKITIDVERVDENLKVVFRDNGCGMDQQTVAKVFDPFFTTKRGTGGSGLGMHILFNQVTQSLGGNIKCNSVVGEGTEFIFSFPYTEGR